ncbi:MAG: amidase, partial [Anaerolineae bacterium]
DYANSDGLALAELVRRKEVTPLELVEEAIRRIEALNPQLNAVIHKMYDQARAAAGGDLPDGPFKGVPFLLKDLTAAYAGEPLRSGCRFLRGFVPDHDSELVRRFKAAGLIVLGKTNTPEFGLTVVTEPELFGPASNPWDLSRTPGGSSGGTAAAVAARMVPLAHGNDGGGSIRVPASCCGLFGLKPSRGRNPLGPDFGELWQGAVCDHVLTRSVRDSAAMLDATAGPDPGAPYFAPPPERPFLDEVGADPGKLRIAFTAEPYLGHSVHDDCLKGLEETVSLLQTLGHELVEAAPQIEGKAFATAFLTMICGEVRADIEEAEVALGRKATYDDFEPATWALGLLGRKFSAVEFSRAIRYLQHATRTVGQFFEDYDLLLTPTLAQPPVLIGALQPEPVEAFGLKLLGRLNAGGVLRALQAIDTTAEKIFDFIPYTPLFNVTGQPAMSVPLYWNAEGLPIGMQFAARYAGEATLFRLAGQLEQAQPWFDRAPPIV